MNKAVSLILLLLITGCGGDDGPNIIVPPEDPSVVQPQANRKPIITSIPTITIIAGDRKDYQIQSRDPDDDVIIYSLSDGPDWATIDSQTGILTLVPNHTHSGNYHFQVHVSDGKISVQTVATVNVILAQETIPPNVIEVGDINITYVDQKVRLNWGSYIGSATYYLISDETNAIEEKTNFPMYEFDLPLKPTTYSLSACNNSGCSDPTGIVVNGKSELADFSVNVTALEQEQAVDVTLTVISKTGDEKHRVIRLSSGLNTKPIVDDIFIGDEVRIVINNTTNNQICRTDTTTFSLESGGNTIDVDCKTVVTTSFPSNYKAYDLAQDSVEIQRPVIKNSNGQPLISPSVIFNSQDVQIAEVIDGNVKLKSLGNTTISATPSDEYYTYNEIKSFRVTVYKLPDNKLEICQSNGCVDITSKFFSIVGERKVLARFYDLNGDFTLEINNSVGNQYTKSFSCNSIAANSVSFNLDETCNIEIPAQFVKNNTQWVLKNKDGMALSLFIPNIQLAKKFILTLVKLRVDLTDGRHVLSSINEEGETELETVAKIKQRLEDRFPFTDIDVKVRQEPMVFHHKVNRLVDADYNSIIQQLRTLRKVELGLDYWDQMHNNYYHVFSPHYTPYYGLAYVGVGVSTSLDPKIGNFQSDTVNCQANLDYCSNRYLQTLTHELGHTLNLLHSPCGTSGGDDWSVVDWLKGSNGALNENTPLFDQTINLLRTPNHQPGIPFFDVMGYCDGQYFSEYNSQKILDFMNKYPVFVPKGNKSKLTISDDMNPSVSDNFKQITWLNSDVGEYSFSPISFSRVKSPKIDEGFTVRVGLENGSVYIAHPYSLSFVHDDNTKEYNLDIPIEHEIKSFEVLDKENNRLFFSDLIKSSLLPVVELNKNTLYFYNEHTSYQYVDVYQLDEGRTINVLLFNSRDKQLTLSNSNPVRVVFKNEFNHKEFLIN